MSIPHDMIQRAMAEMDRRLMNNEWSEACEKARHNIAYEILDAAVSGALSAERERRDVAERNRDDQYELMLAARAEAERLKVEIGGFDNLSALRQAMVDAADENKQLIAALAAERERRENAERKLAEYNSLWQPVRLLAEREEARAEVERLRGLLEEIRAAGWSVSAGVSFSIATELARKETT